MKGFSSENFANERTDVFFYWLSCLSLFFGKHIIAEWQKNN